MSTWTPAARRLGIWSASSVVLVGIVYLVVGLAWAVAVDFRSPELFQPGEPYLAALELLLLLSAPILVVLAAAMHAYAPPDRKTGAVAAIALMAAFACLTAGVHFVRLAVARDLPAEAAAESSVLRLYPWPSMALALDLLAWDLLLGLALILAAPVFGGEGLHAAVRVSMTCSGALCVAGTLGPLLGDMRLQLLGIAGYAVGLPVACALLAKLFHRQRPKALQLTDSTCGSIAE